MPVRAILADRALDVAVYVIDQSAGFETFSALRQFAHDPRLHYFRTNTTGVAAARNIAIAVTDSPWLLFTDDDCEPDPNWVRDMVRLGESSSGPVAIFGPMRPHRLIDRPQERRGGMIPSWVPLGPASIRGHAGLCLGGVTANVALNREAIELTGWFNEALGRGSAVNSAEDYEYAVRLLAAGGTIRHVLSPSVRHMSVVPRARIRESLRTDLRGSGRMLGWLVRGRNMHAAGQLARFVWKEAGPGFGRAAHNQWPLGFMRGLWLLQGFAHGVAGCPLRARTTAPDPATYIHLPLASHRHSQCRSTAATVAEAVADAAS